MLGLGVGIAFNPESDPADVARVADGADIVLCMSIHPGYSGQAFMPDALERIRTLRERLPEEITIQVDGGIDQGNIRDVYDAGARLFVAGNAIFARDDLREAYDGVVHALT
jgi:ribulose-phosphate 3-epimerase